MVEVGFHASVTLSRRRQIGEVEAPSSVPELPPRTVVFRGVIVHLRECPPHMAFDFNDGDIVVVGKFAVCQILDDMAGKIARCIGIMRSTARS